MRLSLTPVDKLVDRCVVGSPLCGMGTQTHVARERRGLPSAFKHMGLYIMDTVVTMFENFPPLAQFILTLIALSGTPTGIIAGMFAVWKIRETANAAQEATKAKIKLEKEAADQKARIEVLEIKQIRAQAEASQAAADRLNTQKLIEVIDKSNERWQRVWDTKSERQLETDKLQQETNRMFLEAVNRQSGVMDNVRETFEIQSRHYSVLIDTVNSIKPDLTETHKEMLKLAEENRSDITKALGMNVNQQTTTENTLRTILNAVAGIEKNVSGIISLNEKERNQNLAAIKTQLQSIEASISNLITPSPVPLGLPDDITNAADVAAEETKP